MLEQWSIERGPPLEMKPLMSAPKTHSKTQGANKILPTPPNPPPKCSILMTWPGPRCVGAPGTISFACTRPSRRHYRKHSSAVPGSQVVWVSRKSYLLPCCSHRCDCCLSSGGCRHCRCRYRCEKTASCRAPEPRAPKPGGPAAARQRGQTPGACAPAARYRCPHHQRR